MAAILFCVYPIAGSVNATLQLARDLQSRGHNVSYAGLPDCEDFVVPHGFTFHPMFTAHFPKGWFRDNLSGNELQKGWLARLRSIRVRLLYVRRFLEGLPSTGGDFLGLHRSLKPHLTIVVATHYDAFIWALLTHKAGGKGLYLHDTFCQMEASGNPPIVTSLVPTTALASRLFVFCAWRVFYLTRFVQGAVLTLGVDFFSRRLLRRLAGSCGYPYEDIDTRSDLLGPKLRWPELVLCPEEFEFSHRRVPGRHYVGACVDLGRDEPDFPWARLDDDRPLIYCALGTVPYRTSAQYLKFYRMLAAFADRRQEFQWVIACAEHAPMLSASFRSPHLTIVSRAPQLGLLRRAALMIGHGGTNTIRECALLGVPMVLFPLGFDQFGNVARAVHHGLGVSARFDKVDEAELGRMIDRVFGGSFHQVQSRWMQEKFQTCDQRQFAVGVAEWALATATNDAHGVPKA